MNVNPWQILCFLAVIIGATIVVFPTQRTLLPQLIDNGQYTDAGAIIDSLLDKHPLDAAVVDQAVRLYLLEGRPDRAIDRLEALRRRSPLANDRLEKLARLYEWRRQPARAVATWERLLEKDPDNPTALTELIGYYRYSGDLARECAGIVRLIHRQGARGLWRADGKRMADLIAAQLDQLANAPDARSPLTAMLASGLYQLYIQALGNPERDGDGEDIHRCLEQFVWTGHLELGQHFAARADGLWHTGIDQQLRMVDVLRWSQMDLEALSLLNRLHEQSPDDRRVLVAMAETAAAANDPQSGIVAYQNLARLMPTDPRYRQQLMALYRQSGRTTALFDEYERQFDATADPGLIPALLKLAREADDPGLQQRALHLADIADNDDPKILKQRAGLYLALNQPENAYPLLKRIAAGPSGTTADLQSMIQVAGYTNTPQTVENALQMGIQLAPRDADLRIRLARFHLARSRQPQAIDAFEHYLELRPDDAVVQKQLAQVYEWQHQPQKALAIYRRLARNHPEDSAAARALTRLMAETGDREGLLELARQQADTDPRNPDLALAAGRALVAEGRLYQGAEYLQRAADLNPRPAVIWQELAQVYEWTGQSDRLIDTLGHLAADGRLGPHQRVLLAEAYVNQRRWSDAAALLGPIETQAELPRREGLMLADAYTQLDRPAAARHLLQRLFEENKNDPVFLADVGQRAQWQQRWDLALAAYATVLKKKPRNLKALKGSGQIYAWTNKPAAAIQALEAYNRLYPRDYETQYLLGELYITAHREADAQKQYRKAMRLINAARSKDNTANSQRSNQEPAHL